MQRFVNFYLERNKNKSEKISGVYKMIFDNKFFYLGSSKNIHGRIDKWKNRLKVDDTHNERISAVFKICSEVRFEVVEVIKDDSDPRIREDFYIKQNWGNPLLLNRSISAFVSSMIRTPEQKARAVVRNRQKVAQFDRCGNLIKVFESVSEAVRLLFDSRLNINKCFKKAGRFCGNFTFKKVDGDGNIIEPPIIKHKPHPREAIERALETKKKRRAEGHYRYIPSLHAKKVNQYDLGGNLIATFPSILSAAKHINPNHARPNKQFQRILNGKRSKTGYYKGYIYKYAE